MFFSKSSVARPMRRSRFSVLKGRKVRVFQHTCFKENKNFAAKMSKWPHHGRKKSSNHVAAVLASDHPGVFPEVAAKFSNAHHVAAVSANMAAIFFTVRVFETTKLQPKKKQHQIF